MTLRLAKKVGAVIKKSVQGNIKRGGIDDEVYIGADGESTYRLDDIAEKVAFEVLRNEGVAVLSEEAGLILPEKRPKLLCVLDPLDGSKNAVQGVPFYCASIAFAPWSSKPLISDIDVGVVVNLVTGDVFEAEKGDGARLNGHRIQTSDKADPGDSIVSLYLKSGYDIISRFEKVRAMGAIALELAHIAAGGLDGLIDNRSYLKVTDVASGKLLIEEAGGRVTDVRGNNLNQSIKRLENVSILAACNKGLHSRILKEGA
jgi:myo-inositol-1(or 4)-monophosphatase